MSEQMLAAHQGPRSGVGVARGRLGTLAVDGWRSFTSLRVDGWLALLALIASAIALAPFVNSMAVRWLDAGVIWQGLYLIACIRLFQAKGIGWPWWLLRRHTWLCGFLLIAVLSTTWSDHPGVSLDRSLSLIGTTLIGVCIGQLLSRHALMTAWMWGLTLLMGVSLGIYLLAPQLADLQVEDWAGRFRGFSGGKNHAGKFLAFGVVLFAAATMRAMIDRSLGVSLTALYVVAAMLTESTTSLLASVAGIGAMAGMVLARRLQMSVPMILGLMVVGTLVLVALGVVYVEAFAGFFGKKPTLSGRTILWQATFDTIAHQPLLGFGYFAIWGRPETNDFLNAFTGQDFHWSSVPHAHNGFIQVATDLGIPVAVLALAYVLTSLMRAIKSFHRDDSPFSLFGVGFIVCFIVLNTGSLTLLRSRSGIWIVFVAITVALARSETRRRRARRGPARQTRDGQIAPTPAAEEQRQHRRPTPPVHEEGEAALVTTFRQQLADALARRDDGRLLRLEELRRQLHDALSGRHRHSLLRLAILRRDLRRTLRRRHGAPTSGGWSGWTALRPFLRSALERRRRTDKDGRPETHADVPSSSLR